MHAQPLNQQLATITSGCSIKRSVAAPRAAGGRAAAAKVVPAGRHADYLQLK
jgi:hypothetical protein